MKKILFMFLMCNGLFVLSAHAQEEFNNPELVKTSILGQKALLKNEMVREKAPDFELRDLDGNKVKLSDYKGKTVILDFWATWCSPCIAMFPVMKATQDRYKESKDVKFLFIHTMEKDSNAVELAGKFLKKNPEYDFHVLMDLKEPATGKNHVREQYGITAIPTKFIIDKEGYIIFRKLGSGNHQKVFLESMKLSAMIDLAQGKLE